MTLRVALVGLGEDWRQRVCPALLALTDQYKVRAVCEQIGHRARQAAFEFNAKSANGFRALVRRADIDAILMFDSQWFGSLPILAACDVGKAVYCDARVGLESDRLETIRQRVRSSGIVFAAGFSYRNLPATLRLKELIATRLGSPQLLFCQRLFCKHRHDTPNAANHIPAGLSPRADGTEFVELVDWCRYVVGRSPVSVVGWVHSGSGDWPRQAGRGVRLDFSDRCQPGSGPIAQIGPSRFIPSECHDIFSEEPRAALKVSCVRGRAYLDLPATLIWFDEHGRHEESFKTERSVSESLLMQFHRATTGLPGEIANLEDALAALSIIEQAAGDQFTG